MTAAETEDPFWASISQSLDLSPPSHAPMLAGAIIPVDTSRVADWLGRLLDVVNLTHARASVGVLDLVEAGIRQDHDQVTATANSANIDPGQLGIVADLAGRPLLGAIARNNSDRIPHTWMHGYCPVCAGWPVIAEMRGLDRQRALRCVRCGTGWHLPWLMCPYCGTTDHDQLGSLVPDDAADGRRVDVCHRCLGYVKTIPTLRELSAQEVALVDASSIELDVAGLERDFLRPSQPGFDLGVRVVPAGLRRDGRHDG
jgi:FdhE protein